MSLYDSYRYVDANLPLQTSVLVSQQDETINNIEVQAQRVEDDTHAGSVFWTY